jgi:hypothetical protein
LWCRARTAPSTACASSWLAFWAQARASRTCSVGGVVHAVTCAQQDPASSCVQGTHWQAHCLVTGFLAGPAARCFVTALLRPQHLQDRQVPTPHCFLARQNGSSAQQGPYLPAKQLGNAPQLQGLLADAAELLQPSYQLQQQGNTC